MADTPKKQANKPPAHTDSRRPPRSKRGGGRPRTFRPFSQQQIIERRAAVPEISYPEQLPVSARREEIKAAIAHNQVVIIAGETGSGKTTQLPKICLELGRGIGALIGHTQPRRIAARSVATRICSELDVKLGGAVGYQVRFTEEVSPHTLIKLMTDGILLAEIQSDPQLLRYDTLIIDEAHERSLNIDFLLGYIAELLPQRPDLKVIITSATIDTQRFAKHFSRAGVPAPIIEVSGRTYPVEIRYQPLFDESEDASSTASAKSQVGTDQVTGILEACDELMNAGPGDILVFLSGEGEIRDTQQAFRDHLKNRFVEPGGTSSTPRAVEVLPLYSRLTAAEQHRIFETGTYRRVILATNVAETSLTVPGIRFVVDPGTARISRYSPRTKVQRLPIEAISQASANQRSGRCGRVADGICIRLYSEEDFLARPAFTQPEIQRTSLASVILHMVSLGLGDIAAFPFIDPPDPKAIRSGTQLLEEIGALDTRVAKNPRLTHIGRQLSQLPIDPRLGRMLLEAQKNGCASEVLVLVAALSVQDVRERPAEKRPQADAFHARFTAQSSDFLAYLTLWRYLRTQQRELSGSAFRRMCRFEYLNFLRFHEWADVVAQLAQMARPLGLSIHRLDLPTPGDIRVVTEKSAGSVSDCVAQACRELGRSTDTPEASAIHKSMLVGLLSNIGTYSEKTRDYQGARNTHFVMWPGSGLHRRTPAWVMAAELVETSRLFARTVAQIQPEWIEPLAKHLVKKSYSEPMWSTRNGAAMCTERVTLYGMTIVADRRILLSSVGTESAKELAREMFVRSGLVEGDWRTHHTFLKENREALKLAEETENKLRRRGVVADSDTLAAFYDERIPAHIVSGRHFDSWWKKEKATNPHLLDFTQEFLLGGETATTTDFPTIWHHNELKLPLSYSFNPGSYGDGVAVTIPVTLLPQVEPVGFDWLVPGMREALIIATIRGLPKPIRRQLVPAPDTAQLLRPLIAQFESGNSFREAFTQAVKTLRGFEISAHDWEQTLLPEHLRMRFIVRSERGTVLDESESLESLQISLAPKVKDSVEKVVKGAVALALDEARRGLLPPPAIESAQSAPQNSKPAQREALAEESTSKITPRDSTAFSSNAGEPLTRWPEVQDGIIPALVETSGPHGMTVRGYPALTLVKTEPCFGKIQPVGLSVLSEPEEQVRDHRLGIIHLVAHLVQLQDARITSRWTSSQALALAGSPYPSTGSLVCDLQLASVRNLVDRWCANQGMNPGELRRSSMFDELCEYVRASHEDEIYKIAQSCAAICVEAAVLAQGLKEHTSIALIGTVTDIRDQMAELVYPGFLFDVPENHLTEVPRYLQGARLRLDKAISHPHNDDALAWQVSDVRERVAQAVSDSHLHPYNLQTAQILDSARWMVEELRVSLFAQQLGTQGKISSKRIEKLLATIGS